MYIYSFLLFKMWLHDIRIICRMDVCLLLSTGLRYFVSLFLGLLGELCLEVLLLLLHN